MKETQIKYILFDAANTLIHKPSLWSAMQAVMLKYGHQVSRVKLQYHHKLLSELTNFPDRTSRQFYSVFNEELLLSLGIIPDEGMLNDFFSACSYLPWEKFEDTRWLENAPLPVGVLSNFNSTLNTILHEQFGDVFENIIVSEVQNTRKPNPEFFEAALNALGLEPKEIFYVGDSLKLDIIPAKRLGFACVLIDRMNLYSGYKERLASLSDLLNLI